MTENNDNDETDDSESLEDVMGALDSTGYAPDEAEDDSEDAEESGGLPGPLRALEELQGTGKSLESYQDSPIASAFGDEDSKGALHIARGIDGLSPLGAMNPLMDIGIGFVLIQMEKGDKKKSDGKDYGEPPEDNSVPDLAEGEDWE